MSRHVGLTVAGTADQAAWREAVTRATQHDCFHLREYHVVAERHGEGTAQLYMYREGEHLIAIPLLLRPVDPTRRRGWLDATSVYGYTGPITSHASMPRSVVSGFQAALTEALTRRRVVAVFSRLHPLIEQGEVLAGLGDCRTHGETISIDLTLDPEEQEAHYSKSCRRTLRVLRDLGFVGLHDAEKRYLPDFVDVYLETMRRTSAESSYLFDQRHFEMLTRELGPAVQLFVAIQGGTVAAATLATVCDGIVQDYLGGTRTEFLRFSPDRLVVDTERTWATRAGATVFHLGGGVGAREDSVFRYKAGFSDRRHTFRTWRWIVRPDVYAELARAASVADDDDGRFFPVYRAANRAPAPTGGANAAAADVTGDPRRRSHRTRAARRTHGAVSPPDGSEAAGWP
jgi:CelD/BcsL family acetyltransferase involved in cellulose biosynthesis